MKKRPCKIYKIELLNYKYPTASFEALVGSGTYIRSIANDL
jgi:tRNA U55 pseudouridine synthase TruB